MVKVVAVDDATIIENHLEKERLSKIEVRDILLQFFVIFFLLVT